MKHECSYSFHGAVLDAIRCRGPEVVLAGPSDTGKTLGFLYKIHRAATKYPKAQIAVIRKVKSDLVGTCLHTFKRDILEPCAPYVTHYGGEYPQWYDYPNGSRIWVGGLDDPGKTLSAERDLVYWNQCEEGTVSDWEHLTRITTGRGAAMPYTQLIGDCNPASSTHWILQRRDAGKLAFFEATHRDNPQLYDPATGDVTAEGEQRIGRLRNLTGVRYKRLYQGIWAAPEGVIYEAYDEDRDRVASFPIPRLWPRVVGVDPYGAHIAAVWLAFDPGDRCLHAYREYVEPFGVTTAQHAANVGEIVRRSGETVLAFVGGGPSERQQRTDWADYAIPLVEPPFWDVWSGIDRVINLFSEGRLKVHDCCVNLVSEVGDYRRVQNKRTGEFTDAIYNKEAYNCLDALRYGVAWLTGGEEMAQVVYRPVQIGRQY